MRGATPLDVAAASVMDNNELALALKEPDLEKVNLHSAPPSSLHPTTNVIIHRLLLRRFTLCGSHTGANKPHNFLDQIFRETNTVVLH